MTPDRFRRYRDGLEALDRAALTGIPQVEYLLLVDCFEAQLLCRGDGPDYDSLDAVKWSLDFLVGDAWLSAHRARTIWNLLLSAGPAGCDPDHALGFWALSGRV